MVAGGLQRQSHPLECSTDDTLGQFSQVQGGCVHCGHTQFAAHETAMGIGLIYMLADGSKLFGKFSTVYRYPFVDEQVSYFGYGMDQLYADVEAETGESYEFGTELPLCGGGCRVGLTGFLQNMKDEIAFNGMTMVNENLDRTRRIGAEASMQCSPLKNLQLCGDYTFTEAEFTEGINNGNTIPLVADHVASVSARVTLPLDLTLYAKSRYVGSRVLGGDTGNTGETLSPYTVTDVSLRYSPACCEGLDVFAAVDNVFNEEYAEVAYMTWTANGYYPSPERSVRAGVSYRF